MKTAREIYIENMQRENAIVASELSKYLDTLGVKYKMESSVYIGIKICNKLIVELTDCSAQKAKLLEEFVAPYLENGSKVEKIQAVDFLKYYSEDLHKKAWNWLRTTFSKEYGHLDSDLDKAVQQKVESDGHFAGFKFARSMVSVLSHTNGFSGFWQEEVIEAKGQMGLF